MPSMAHTFCVPTRPFLLRPFFFSALVATCGFGAGCPGSAVNLDAGGSTDAGTTDSGPGDEVTSDAGVSDAGTVLATDGGGAEFDAGTPLVDAGDGGDAGRPTCVQDGSRLDCAYESFNVATGLGPRRIHVATPSAPPPPGGYPVVLFFQGSFFPGEGTFTGVEGGPFGQFHLVDTARNLLEAGFVVAAPDALAGGTTFWQTNIAPFALFWEGSADDLLMQDIFSDLETNRYAPTDASKLFAMGISSGGFMTSRMAVSYPGRFTALAIHSGSYATCGAVCFVPDMPQVHPPTLFMHVEDDRVVHPPRMRLYRDALDAAGFETQTEVVAGGHAWLEPSATDIPAFFLTHLASD